MGIVGTFERELHIALPAQNPEFADNNIFYFCGFLSVFIDF